MVLKTRSDHILLLSDRALALGTRSPTSPLRLTYSPMSAPKPEGSTGVKIDAGGVTHPSARARQGVVAAGLLGYDVDKPGWAGDDAKHGAAVEYGLHGGGG